jgi:cation transport ATPase
VLIRPGSKVPVDAVVEEGESQVDESTVTGESLPVKKTVGDQLIGATINKNGMLRARTTAVGADTALAQVVKLVQEAQNSKAPGQRLADKAAFWLVFTPLPEQAVGDVVLAAQLGHRLRAFEYPPLIAAQAFSSNSTQSSGPAAERCWGWA